MKFNYKFFSVKKYLVISVIVILSAALIFMFVKFVPLGKASPGEISVSEVEIGTVMSTLPAEGTVEPESEVLILSPASSIIKRIVKDVGSKVNAGEAIIIMDPTPIQEQIEKLEDQLEVKRNSLQKNRLNARSIRVDLDYNVEVRKLKIASIKSELADQEQLLEVGAISPARFEKTKQELVLADKDLETLKERNAIKLEQLNTDDAGLKLQIAIQEKELEYQNQLFNKMIIRAPSAGIILSLDGVQGEKVNKDKLLIKMSNLSNFKISASTDDDNSDFIKTGHQVLVQLAGEELNGQIGTISPMIKNKKVEFDVYLSESNHYKLRANLTLPLKIVVDRVDSVMRVHNGPGLQRSGECAIYQVEGDVAYRKIVTVGLKGDEYIEIQTGLMPGDQIVMSDISLFRNKEQVDIN